MASTGRSYEYTRYYRSFLGLDLTESDGDSSKTRASNMENMYRDYYGSDGASLETVPGFRRLFSFFYNGDRRRINSILHYTPKKQDKEILVIHAGRSIYTLPLEERDTSEPTLIPLTCYENGEAVYNENPLANKKSRMFECDGRLFILDTKGYFCLDGESLRRVEDIAYIPTTFADGEEYEQKNLLTDRFYAVYNLQNSLDSLSKYEQGSEGLIYRITGDNTCAVEGTTSTQTNIYIPSRAIINGKSYEVTEISAYAFKDNSTLSELKISEGVTQIGAFSFLNCTALRSISLPDSITKLGIGAFMNCSSLFSAVIGNCISTVHASCFFGSGLSTVYFRSSEEEWRRIQKNESDTVLNKVSLVCQYHENDGSFIFYLNERCRHLEEVTLDGTPLSTDGKEIRYLPLYEGEYVYAILVSTLDVNLLLSRRLTISGRRMPYSAEDRDEFLQELTDFSGDPLSLIFECSLCAAFDGRIFFSGNPHFPSTVFYTSRGIDGRNLPEYVGELNHFSVGRTDSPVSALLPNGEELAVFKSDNEKGGIYIYTPADTESDLLPRIYVCRDSVSGVGALGNACKFYSDTVFLSDRGLDALARSSINSALKVLHRSSNVDPALLKARLDNATLCRWLGYLVIATGDEFFLADSRRTFKNENGDVEYEWYRLKGIGTYLGQYARFDYTAQKHGFEDLSVFHDGIYLKIEEKEGEPLEDSRAVRSGYAFRDTENGYVETQTLVYYTVEKDDEGALHCYLCDSDGEMTGGEFFPASTLYGANELLFFGTESGDLCCFNNDKRNESGDIDIEYYTFNNRRYVSGIVTAHDNCGIPHLTKSTKRRSLCLHLKTFGRGQVKVGVLTDKKGWTEVAEAENSSFSFDSVEFDSFTFNTSSHVVLPLSEKEKRWIQKQYRIFSDEYKRPFGIFGLSYRYKVAGRIKE